jgi:hypothetical protein
VNPRALPCLPRFAAAATLLALIVTPAPAGAASVTVAPDRAVAGAELALSGSGFARRRRGAVRVAGGRSIGVLSTGAGTFSRAVELPRGTRGGHVALRVRFGRRLVALRLAVAREAPRASGSLSAASDGTRVRLLPISASPGTRVTLTGRVPRQRVRARASVRLTVRLAGSVVARGRAGRSGAFRLRFMAPGAVVRAHRLVVGYGRRTLAIPFAGRPPTPPAGAPTGPPALPSVPAIVRDPVLGAAADIACAPGEGPTPSSCQQAATAQAMKSANPDLVALVGDEQYEGGTAEEFRGAFDPTWGPLKAILRPVPGNHEYGSDAKATGYFDYFGALAGPDRTRGYYSYDLGAWHLIALNSNCKRVGGCDAASPQHAWLRADLAAHPNRCVLAYWHHALFSSAAYPEEAPSMAPIWQALQDAGADVVLTGHAHAYERFAPQTVDRRLDRERGMREFVVGSGGKEHIPYGLTRAPNSETSNDYEFGVLALTLHPAGYDWRFVSAGLPGVFSDAGSSACH